MKNQRNFIAAIAVLVLGIAVATPAEAQRPGQRQGPGGGQMSMMLDIDERMETLTEQLSLTEEQVTKVRKILEEQLEAATALMSQMRSGGGGRGAMRERMMTLRERTTAAMKEALTEDQMAKYEEIVAQERSRRRPL